MKVILAISTFCLLFSSYDGVTTTSNINGFMDKFLKAFHQTYDGELEPSKIKNATLEFSYKVMFLERKVRLQTYDGTVAGLSSLERDGEATLTKYDDRKIKLETTLKTGSLQVNTQALASFGLLSRNIGLEYRIPSLQMEVEAVSDRQAKIRFRRFKIVNMEATTLHVSRMGTLEFLVNTMVPFAKPFLKDKVVKLIETNLKEILEEYINKNSPLSAPTYM